MSNQDFERERWATSQATTEGMSRPTDQSQVVRGKAQEAFSKASDIARNAGDKATRAASETASMATDSVKDLLNRQIGTGAGLAGHFANSVRLAADDISRESPMVGGLVRGLATQMDKYADQLQDQTVDQLTRAASDYTRRQPALVFGLAALAGFFAFRTIKSAQSITSPSLQPGHQGQADGF